MVRGRQQITFVTMLVSVFLIGCIAGAAPVNLANGMTYTYNVEPNENYPDNGGQLTDGVYGLEFDDGDNRPHLDPHWIGTQEDVWVITLDLEAVHAIDQVRSSFLKYGGAAIRHPLRIEVSLSIDGDNWTSLGRRQFEHANMPQGATTTTFFNVSKEARYVRYTIEKEGQWIFADEIEVIGLAPAEVGS